MTRKSRIRGPMNSAGLPPFMPSPDGVVVVTTCGAECGRRDNSESIGAAMKSSELVDSAVNKVDGVRELSRRISWDAGNISKVREGLRPLPPWRAAQLAEIIGSDPRLAYIEALKEQSSFDGEKKLLGELLRACKAMFAYLTIAGLLATATFLVPETSHASTKAPEASNIYIMCY